METLRITEETPTSKFYTITFPDFYSEGTNRSVLSTQLRLFLYLSGLDNYIPEIESNKQNDLTILVASEHLMSYLGTNVLESIGHLRESGLLVEPVTDNEFKQLKTSRSETYRRITEALVPTNVIELPPKGTDVGSTYKIAA